MILIENWALFPTPVDPYTPPEDMVPVFCGNIFNHPSKTDGEMCFIHLRNMVSFDGVSCLHSQHRRIYRIGAPDEQYEWNYPGARARLIKQFSKSLPFTRIRK